MSAILLLDVVGLTPSLLELMPRISRLAEDGFRARLDTVLPAVTCTVQASLTTGLSPAEHGIVGNGWYFRELGEVFLWRQSHDLVHGETMWDAARRSEPDYRVANMCWWYAMGDRTDYAVTPRPVYHADGRKEPDCYTIPPALHDDLTGRFGTFPLFNYWGPTAGIASSRWIGQAAEHVMRTDRPDLVMAYLPHLDYDLQRYGPDSPQAAAAAAAVDEVVGDLADAGRSEGRVVVVVSEYGITSVSRPVDVNRALRRAGLLAVHRQAGMEYLDPLASAAFAVADHQIAHIYVRDPARRAQVAELLAELPGVGAVLDDEGKRAAGLAHSRAGDLVALAEPDAWFTYYYWLDDAAAPDFARCVEIHRKPGYDPAELFLDPGDSRVKLRAGLALARKKLGLRYTMNVIPLDPASVRGSHGLLPAHPDQGPLLICSDRAFSTDRLAVTDVKSLLLDVAGITHRAAPSD